jgi:hypothetical protein
MEPLRALNRPAALFIAILFAEAMFMLLCKAAITPALTMLDAFKFKLLNARINGDGPPATGEFMIEPPARIVRLPEDAIMPLFTIFWRALRTMLKLETAGLNPVIPLLGKIDEKIAPGWLKMLFALIVPRETFEFVDRT